jgi:hypothetical protein
VKRVQDPIQVTFLIQYLYCGRPERSLLTPQLLRREGFKCGYLGSSADSSAGPIGDDVHGVPASTLVKV